MALDYLSSVQFVFLVLPETLQIFSWRLLGWYCGSGGALFDADCVPGVGQAQQNFFWQLFGTLLWLHSALSGAACGCCVAEPVQNLLRRLLGTIKLWLWQPFLWCSSCCWMKSAGKGREFLDCMAGKQACGLHHHFILTDKTETDIFWNFCKLTRHGRSQTLLYRCFLLRFLIILFRNKKLRWCSIRDSADFDYQDSFAKIIFDYLDSRNWIQIWLKNIFD